MISVVVPIYNVEKYLEGCLQSIINQTFRDTEILCIDDGTLDNSINIVKKYMRIDPRIRLITHEENRGLGGARNTGIRYAKGEYITFVDSDDELELTTLEKCYKAMIENDVDAVVYGINRVFGEDERIHYTGFHSQITPDTRVYNISDHKERLVEMWPSANKLYKKELIDKYACSFPERLLYEDHYFFFNYFAHARNFYYINEALYNYTASRPGSITSGATGRENEVYTVLEILEPVFKNFFPQDLWEKSYARICFRLIWERQNVLLSSAKDWEQFCSNAEKWLKERFDLKMLQSAVDTNINRTDAFYRYIFSTGRKKLLFRIKLLLKKSKFILKVHSIYKRFRDYRTVRSYTKELVWVCWENKQQIERLIKLSDEQKKDIAI